MTMKKIKFMFNFTKEEKWINDMAAEGWHLTDYTFAKYHFEKGEPGSHEYRIEYLEHHPDSSEGKAYIDFLAEGGIDCVAHFGHWAYFRKETANEPFEIYSDTRSKKKHFQRIIFILLIVWVMNLVIGISNSFLSSFNTISFYVSFLNWAVVMCFGIIMLQYWKNIRELPQEDDLFSE